MRKPIGIVALALVASLSFAGIALADDAEEPPATMATPLVVVDEEAGTVTIALPVDGELPECEEPAEPPADEAENGDESYGPGSCIVLTIEHPSGKMHHGAVVSTVAKALHPSTLDGIKKGEIMRWVAKGGTVEEADPKEKPEKVKKDKPDKAKKDKPDKTKNGKPEKARKDKPDHPGKGNAYGKNKHGKGGSG